MQPTSINAFRVELEEAKAEEVRAHSKVETLRETVATMEQAERDANPSEVVEPTVPAPAESAEDSSVAELENLSRPDLEAEASEAGVEDPEAAKNKHELAEEVVAAKSEAEAPADVPEAEPEEVSEPDQEDTSDADNGGTDEQKAEEAASVENPAEPVASDATHA